MTSLRIAVSMGDPAGIGPTLLIQSLIGLFLGRKNFDANPTKQSPHIEKIFRAALKARHAREISELLQKGEIQIFYLGYKESLQQHARVLGVKLRFQGSAKNENPARPEVFQALEFAGETLHSKILKKLPSFSRRASLSAKPAKDFDENAVFPSEEKQKHYEAAVAARGESIGLGEGSHRSAAMALLSLQYACWGVELGIFDALATAPLSKYWVKRIEPSFHDHTGYLQQYFYGKGLLKDSFSFNKQRFSNGWIQEDSELSMAFVSKEFSVVLASIHQPLSKVAESLSKAVYRKKLFHAIALQKALGDAKPLLTLGLNPHAGEGGTMGHEEKYFQKCIDDAKRLGHAIVGPVPADTAFQKLGPAKDFQTVLACYHDQGLIPVKSLLGQEAVNVSVGLPFIRCSPDHGTAYDIAAKGICNPVSFIESMYWCCALSR